MANIVLLGGNGYIGRNTTKEWMKRDPEAMFFVVSRSGKNQLEDEHIVNIQDDLSDVEALKGKLPAEVDYIVSFVGVAAVPKGSDKTLSELNIAPAKVERELAEFYNVKAMGAIGGKLGTKAFVKSKADMLAYLRESKIPVEAVEPTLVIGAGRKDALTRMAPMLKFFGIFYKNAKPVQVEDVVKELVDKMLSH